MGGGDFSSPMWPGYESKMLYVDYGGELVAASTTISVGYNNDSNLLWFGEVSGPILYGGGVHLRNITPVEVQRIILMNATRYPPLITDTIDAFLVAMITL